jgi:hypothetical protein
MFNNNANMPSSYVNNSQKNNAISRKWGFKDINACESLEIARRYIIQILSNPVVWGTFTISQANYFLSVLEFEAGWIQGNFCSYMDFWGGQSDKEENVKKADKQSYYDKARIYLNTIINPIDNSGVI